jgi:hypothetical protein
MSIVAMTSRLSGAAALFTEVVAMEWDGPNIKVTARSGDFVVDAYITPEYAMDFHHRVTVLLKQKAEIVEIKPKRRKGGKRKKR